MAKSMFRIGINARDDEVHGVLIQDGRLILAGVSDSGDLEAGIEKCLGRLANQAGLDYREMLKQTGLFAYATDITAKILAHGQGPRVGLILTKGYEETLYATSTTLIPKGILIPEDLIQSVDEAVDTNGKVIQAVNKAEIYSVAKYLMERGAQTVAICLKNAYYNAENERVVENTIDKEISKYYLGGVAALSSHKVSAAVEDYVRLNTTVVNLFVHRNTANMLRKIDARLRESNLQIPTRIVSTSLGGLKRIHKARALDLQASPDVACLLAGIRMKDFVEDRSGTILVTEMGLSSTTIGVIQDGRYDYNLRPLLGGFPVDMPMPAVKTISIGAHSIARVNGDKQLHIGPELADLGPVCFDRGGTEPTVMDADVVLGYIPQVYEGKRLDRTKAAEAIKAKIADTSKISVEEAAIRIKEVADKAIGDAIRQELPLDGLKPKDFDVYVTGSLGSIHGACYGVASGARRIVVFPMGASLAAYGAAVADIVYEFRVPFVGMLCNTQGKAVLKDLDGLEQAVQSLKEAALKDIKAEGKLGEDPIFSPHLLVRYPGGDERIITANTLDTKEDIQKICDGFKKQYPANGNKAIELVAVMVEAVCSTGKVELVKKGKSEKNSKSKASEKRRIYVKTGFTDLEVYSYEDLGSGSKVKGPALLQRDDEIVAFVPERHELTMNQYGVGIIEKSSR